MCAKLRGAGRGSSRTHLSRSRSLTLSLSLSLALTLTRSSSRSATRPRARARGRRRRRRGCAPEGGGRCSYLAGAGSAISPLSHPPSPPSRRGGRCARRCGGVLRAAGEHLARAAAGWSVVERLLREAQGGGRGGAGARAGEGRGQHSEAPPQPPRPPSAGPHARRDRAAVHEAASCPRRSGDASSTPPPQVAPGQARGPREMAPVRLLFRP